MLATRNLSYHIGNLSLVKNVSFEVQAGELVAIVGANGAGKTTLLRLLAGELKPSSGEVLLAEQPLSHYKMRDLALQRAVMRQHVFMNFDFTTYEVVMMGRHPHIQNGETKEDHSVVEAMLQLTEAAHLRDQLYATLSGGEKARVTLARVLAQKTKILLLDEPTGAMDLRHQQMTMRLARQLADQGNLVIAILHDLNLAAMYANRVGMMQKGELVTLGHPGDVLTTENIQQVFNLAVHVMPHPHQNCPLIVPIMPA